jgi:hypothetical protein
LAGSLLKRGDEVNTVRKALIDLHDVLRVYLLDKIPAFRDAWTKSEPDYQFYDWRIKAEFAASSGD